MTKTRSPLHVLIFVLLAGCASTSRSCSSGCAQAFGADWVVVQMDNDGRPYRCWALLNASVTSESGDGIYWKDNSTDNLVHISGHFNRVQVINSNWVRAYSELGLTSQTCAQIRGQMYDPESRSFVTREK